MSGSIWALITIGLALFSLGYYAGWTDGKRTKRKGETK